MLIDRICIRAQDDQGKWGSYSLGELVDKGKAGLAFGWILGRLCGYQEGATFTRDHIEKLAKHMKPGTYVFLNDK